MRSCSFHAVLTRLSPSFAPFSAGDTFLCLGHRYPGRQERSDTTAKKMMCAAAFVLLCSYYSDCNEGCNLSSYYSAQSQGAQPKDERGFEKANTTALFTWHLHGRSGLQKMCVSHLAKAKRVRM
jgi:hypothetical protein